MKWKHYFTWVFILGKWEKIRGRFIFASDYYHQVGEIGGEERHTLTIDEISSHNHQNNRFKITSEKGCYNGDDWHALHDHVQEGNYTKTEVGNLFIFQKKVKNVKKNMKEMWKMWKKCEKFWDKEYW